MGEQISWPMLTEIKKADNIWACNALFQELDATFIQWRGERETFFDGDSPLLFACFDEEKRAVHQRYMDKVRQEDPDAQTDKLTAALVLRLLIVGRKTLHRHKAEQLEGGHLQQMGDGIVKCLPHMRGDNDSSERLHGLNNSVMRKDCKRGMRNAEGLIMARGYNLSAATTNGEITRSELQLAKKIAAEHARKNVS